MWVEFLKARQGYGYFAGNKANLDDETANKLINEGFVKPVSRPQESNLPHDLPGRTALISAGLLTKKEVLAAKETLTDIKGIGEKLKEEILQFLEN